MSSRAPNVSIRIVRRLMFAAVVALTFGTAEGFTGGQAFAQSASSSSPPTTAGEPFEGLPQPKECGPAQSRQALAGAATQIFTGTLTTADIPPVAPTGLEATAYVFAVDRVYKGTVTANAKVYALPPANPIGMGNVAVGTRYVVYAVTIQPGNPFRPTGTPDNSLYGSVCQGLIQLGALDPTPAYLGNGTAPEPDPSTITVPPTTLAGAVDVPPPPRDWKPDVIKAAIALGIVGLIARLLSLRIPGRRRRVIKRARHYDRL